jgi:hypothetical protein
VLVTPTLRARRRSITADRNVSPDHAFLEAMRLRVLPIVSLLLATVAVFAWTAAVSDGLSPKAARVKPPAKSPDLWATINVCDTALHPDTIGIRGSMPGIGRVSALWMRFSVQYFATTGDGKWHTVADNADSGWKRLGRTRKRVVEAGQNFTFQPPANGGVHRLRGVVQFKWTRRGDALLRLRRVTTAGHRSTAGADPEGYSAAVCDIT